MFSLMTLGMHALRNTNIYHTLLISAFILLLANPGYILQVGFQLSYAAILGIVSIQPLLSKALKSRNRFIKALWNLCCVSVAAQIGTLPLAIYYFHQFPTLFVITNLLVIPMVSVLMYLGLTCFLFSILNVPYELTFRVF